VEGAEEKPTIKEIVEIGVPKEKEEGKPKRPKEERLPSHAAADDIGSFVAKLLKNIQNLKDEIMVLEIEVESAQNTLKGLRSKLSSGAIDKAKFTKMSQQYTSKIKSIAAQISEKQEEKEGVFRRLRGLGKRIEWETEEHKETLQKIDKLIRSGGPKRKEEGKPKRPKEKRKLVVKKPSFFAKPAGALPEFKPDVELRKELEEMKSEREQYRRDAERLKEKLQRGEQLSESEQLRLAEEMRGLEKKLQMMLAGVPDTYIRELKEIFLKLPEADEDKFWKWFALHRDEIKEKYGGGS
jgi:predicted  nucleic acid-binding Zn-ribbon protein